MRAYTDLLVHTCHRRGAHAIGGMAAFIPSRRDEEVNRVALDQRPRGQGARGRARASTAPGWPTPTSCRWPGRSSTASSATGRTRRTSCARTSPSPPTELLDFRIEGGRITEDGVRANISHRPPVPRLLAPGPGRRRHPQPDGGRRHGRDLPRPALAVDPPRRRARRRPQGHPGALPRAARSGAARRSAARTTGKLRQAVEILDGLVLSRDFVPFLTVEAYGYLE